MDHPSHSPVDRSIVARIDALQGEIDRLRRELADGAGHDVRPTDAAALAERVRDVDPPVGSPRRRLFRLAGAAALGTAGATLVRTDRVAALDGSAVIQGQENTGQNLTQIIATESSALLAIGAGFGVAADGGAANALFASSGPAPTADLAIGSLYVDQDGSWWAKVRAGVDGWSRMASATGAGVFHPITPARVYDSRLTMSPMASGPLGSRRSRVIDVSDRRDPASGAVTETDVVPAGARAVGFNITVTRTVQGGFVAVNPGDDETVNGSILNWSSAGQTVANAGIVGVDESRRLSVVVGGPPTASTDFIIDISGYFL